MKRKKSREISIFGVSFLDVLANTIGGLAFLLILAVMMVGAIVFAPPLIMTEKLPDGYHNRAYTVWLGARDGLGKYQWSFGEGKRPKGLELEALTGKLSGVLALDSSQRNSQKFKFSIICATTVENTQDQPKIDQRNYQMTVHRRTPINTIPLKIMTERELPAAYLDKPYPLVFAAEGGQAPYTWTVSEHFPDGLSLIPGGLITGRPTSEGEFVFDATVTSAQGKSKTATFSLNISTLHPPPPPPPPLEILTESLPEAVAQRPYRIWPAAQGGKPPYKWNLVSGKPGWLKISADAAAFAGRPELLDVDENSLVLRVTDASGQSLESAAMKLNVLPPAGKKPPPLEIMTTSLPDARVGQSYELAIAVKGGYPPYQWQSVAQEGAAGIHFSTEGGLISGAPEQAGNISYPMTVTDVAGQQDSVNLSLRIHPPLTNVKILSSKVPDGRVGQQYTFELSAAGGYPPYSWSIVDGQLPPQIKLEEKSGRISGQPKQAGRWPVQFAVADAEGRHSKDRLTVKMHVLTRKGARKLIITSEALPTLLVGETANLTLACEGGTEPYDWQIKPALPAGVKLEEGRIIGEPSQTGTYEMEFIVNDSGGETASAILPLTVKHMLPFWLVILLAVLLAIAILIILFLVLAYWQRKPPVIPPLQITTESIPNARASCDYSVQLACIGGEPPYRWRIIDGELPPGLELSKDGKIAGRPFEGISVDSTKDVPFTVEVIDHRKNKTTRPL